MRQIKRIILHCSATKAGQKVKVNGKEKPVDAAVIKGWHVNSNGWADIGYHIVVTEAGKIEQGRPISQAGAHTSGHNADSIGICYVGGLDATGKAHDTRSWQQTKALYAVVKYYMDIYGLTLADVHCHNEYSSKACPCFQIDEFRRKFKEFYE